MARDCFTKSQVLGWRSETEESEITTYDKSDLDLLLELDQYHVLTSIKVCTDRA